MPAVSREMFCHFNRAMIHPTQQGDGAQPSLGICRIKVNKEVAAEPANLEMALTVNLSVGSDPFPQISLSGICVSPKAAGLNQSPLEAQVESSGTHFSFSDKYTSFHACGPYPPRPS